MTKSEALNALMAAGANCLDQRGFYSHFLRVRYPDFETVTTIDFTSRGNLPARSVRKALRMVEQKKAERA